MGSAEALTLTSNTVTLDADSIGKSFTVNYDGSVERTSVNGLSAQASFTLRSFSGTQAIFDVLLENTSEAPITASRISALGFNVDPNISGVSIVNPTLITGADATNIFANANFTGNVNGNVQFPNGFGAIDLCFINNNNNCSGGGKDGVTIGKTGSFAFALAFSPSTSSFVLDNFGVRYQSIKPKVDGKDSGTGKGTVFVPPSPPDAVIPTPAAVLPGLMGMGAAAFRKKKQGEQDPQEA